MEIYQNYQGIINAIKAEYVKVRDLKRVANHNKRVLNNSDSFINRKGNEKATLENRVANIKTDVNLISGNSYGTIHSRIGTDFNGGLRQSIAALANIESEIDRIVNRAIIDEYEYYEGLSDSEIQSINSLKGVLASAINEVKNIYNIDILSSSKFYNLKETVKVTSSKNSNTEIISTYDSLLSNIKAVINSTRIRLYDYVEESRSIEQGLMMTASTTAGRVQMIETYKSELADLLNSNAPQTEIDAKEAQIEQEKENAIDQAKYQKNQLDFADNFYTNRHAEFSVYFEVINNLVDEFNEFTAVAEFNFILAGKTYQDLDIQQSINELYRDIIRAIPSLLTVEINNTLTYVSGHHLSYQTASSKVQQTAPLFEFTQFINFDERGNIELQKNIPNDTWFELFNYFRQLHETTKDYVAHVKQGDNLLNMFTDTWESFESYYNYILYNLLDKLRSRVSEHVYFMQGFDDKMYGKYIGTSEQEEELERIRELIINGNAEVIIREIEVNISRIKYQVFQEIFPDLYFQLIENELQSTQQAFNTAQTEYNTLLNSWAAVENSLAGLDAGTPEWNAAIIDRDAKLAAKDAFFTDVYTPAMTAYNEANTAYSEYTSTDNHLYPVPNMAFTYADMENIHYNLTQKKEQLLNAQNDWNNINQELENLSNQMTFQESSTIEIVQADAYWYPEMIKSERDREVTKKFVDANVDALHGLKERILVYRNEVISWQTSSPEEEQILLSSMVNSLKNNNSFYTEYLHQSRMVELFYNLSSTVNTENVEMYLFGNGNLAQNINSYFNPGTITVQDLSSTPDYIPALIREGMDMFRANATVAYADKVIDYVNTGVFNRS